ncbi:hypothetical protein GJ672_07010 [Spiribacter sp. 2438]|uniref:hypothetical protein n=1 Tax=Spiribacter sp. 2438 TaxID=2666185 RepID=UPI0012B010EB|nr:hypothetical protein [Spiribacter sp. 2438]QGM22030.1 hypothetical protein GJ672_07010 [Spiribacter sp. 2438]
MAKAKTDSMMNLAQEWMDIQRNYLMSSMQAMQPKDGKAASLNGVMHEELETTREAVERTLALEEKAIDEMRRGTSEMPGVSGMVDMMSEASRNALKMRSQLWQAWFDQMESAQKAAPSTSSK